MTSMTGKACGLWFGIVGLGIACAVAGCAPGPRPRSDPYAEAASKTQAPLQRFDERSGATWFVVRSPIVLARARTDVAANVRDYATLVALQEDHAGQYATWLVVHRWSTVDPRFTADRGVASGQLTLVADGRSIALAPAPAPPPILARADLLWVPRAHGVQSFIYPIDVATLRYLAATHEWSLHFDQDAWPDAYTLWQDGRAALQGLLLAR